MTRNDRVAAWPLGCRVRKVNNHDWIGKVRGWSKKYDALYVLKIGTKSGVSVLGACHLWERCDGEPIKSEPCPAVDEHW